MQAGAHGGATRANDFEKLDSKDDLLTGEDATLYRALAARANYLSLDRPDLGFSAKELCREFSQPTKLSVEKLKRLVRYVVNAPRLVWKYDFQPDVKDLDTYVDTDFAGCMRTRRSTSGGIIRRGAHVLQAWSTTQTTVALSSGEAELSGICRGSSKGIGLRALAQDLGLMFNLRVFSDATAAIGICRRKGLGRVRHLAVADLWIQDKIRCKDFQLLKVLGKDNPADLMTKYVDQQTLHRHLDNLGLMLEKGRAASAPALTHTIVPLETGAAWDHGPMLRYRSLRCR